MCSAARLPARSDAVTRSSIGTVTVTVSPTRRIGRSVAPTRWRTASGDGWAERPGVSAMVRPVHMFCLRLCCGPKWRGGSAGMAGRRRHTYSQAGRGVHDCPRRSGRSCPGWRRHWRWRRRSFRRPGRPVPASPRRTGWCAAAIAGATSPQAVDVGVVQPEDRVQRGCVRAIHQAAWAADVVVHRVVGGVLEGSALRLAILQEELHRRGVSSPPNAPDR